MSPDIFVAIGGIGLFLLGMLVLTEGLKDLAGNNLRRLLARFTTNPTTGAAAGAVTTAVIQSSSATTITAIGFVGAGLMTFPQALGIIFGANIGTTMTGWMVALIGFKLKLGVIVLPLVLIGVFLRMFTHGWLRSGGWALAGFSLLFIGLDTMQQGMSAFEGFVTPINFPSDTLLGRLQLVMIGVGITLVTQSSSAGVATAMVALASGTISFPQAAAMVIGMDVGTTFTAVLATIGGSTAMRQTGYAHVIYNVLTGVMAFGLVGFYTDIVTPLITTQSGGDAQVALVAFHSLFNILGVLFILPFASSFARLISSIIPDQRQLLTERLDEKLIADPAAAVDTATGTIKSITHELFCVLADLLDPHLKDDAEEKRVTEIHKALDETKRYLNRVKTGTSQVTVHERHVSAIHAVDHLNRLADRCKRSDPLKVRRSDKRLQRLARSFELLIQRTAQLPYTEVTETTLDRWRQLLRRQRRSYRHRMIVAASKGQIDASHVGDRLDSVRWMHRSAYHAWRIVHHLRICEASGLTPNVQVNAAAAYPGN